MATIREILAKKGSQVFTIGKGATVLMAAFGSGYTWAGAVARF